LPSGLYAAFIGAFASIIKKTTFATAKDDTHDTFFGEQPINPDNTPASIYKKEIRY
jgi:hypothetical protein